MKKILFTIIFLMTIATYSQEKVEGTVYDGWTFIYKSEKGGNEYYYQPFKKNTVWFKTVYSKPKKHEENNILQTIEHTIISDITLYVFDCDEKEIGVKSSGYRTKEAVVDFNQNSSIDMKIPFPDTMESFYLKYFCENIKDKK